MSAYLYVDGLTPSVSMEALIRLFSQCGTVLCIEILPPLHQEVVGMAIVQMESTEEADRAIQVTNKITLNGRVLTAYKDPIADANIQVRSPHD
jgi:RNA recognition motif. (a.k.a. RRM, RBD, or RNP domain)